MICPKQHTNPASALWLPVAFLAVLVAGCSESDPGLEERVRRLDAELRQKSAALEAAEQRNLTAQTSAASGPAIIPRQEAQSKLYEATGRLRSELEAHSADSVHGLFPEKVTGPDSDHPFSSELRVLLKGSGEQVEARFPVQADARGNWKLPTAGAILEAAQARRVSQRAPAPAAGPATEPAATPVDVVPSHRTHIHQWEGEGPAQRAPRQPAAQAPQTEVPARPRVQPAMPAEREVIIDFGD